MKKHEFRITERSRARILITYYTAPHGEVWTAINAEKYKEYLESARPDFIFEIETRTIETTDWRKL